MRHLLKMSAFGALLGMMMLPFALAAQLSWSGRLVTGLGLTNLQSQNNTLSGNPKPGSIIGLGVACHPNTHFAIDAGILLEQKGNQPDVQLTDIEGNIISNGRAKSRFDYLVVPLTFQWRFGNDWLQYGPYVGAYWARLLRQTFVVPFDENNTFKEDQTDRYEKSDLGAIAGFGVDFAVDATFSLSLETRYSLGLKNTAILSDQKAYHQSLAFLLGVRFKLGKEM